MNKRSVEQPEQFDNIAAPSIADDIDVSVLAETETPVEETAMLDVCKQPPHPLWAKWGRALSLVRLVALTALIVVVVGTQSASAQNYLQLTNIELIILLDESFSMWTNTDPNDNRGDAVELFLTALGVDRSVADYRGSIITFGTTADTIGSDAFFQIKAGEEREAVLEAFRTERQNTDGWTNVLDALKIANAVLDAEHRSGYKPIIVLITDGKPETPTANDDNPEALKAYIEEVKTYAADEFDDFVYEGVDCPTSGEGAPIYTIALRNSAEAATYTQEERELWQTISSLTGGGYEEILPSSDLEFQQRLQTIFFENMREWMCLNVEDSSFTEVPSTQTFSVDASQAGLYFQIAKSHPAVEVEIINAGGEVVTPGDYNAEFRATSNGLNDSWNVLRPDEGDVDSEGNPRDTTNWAGEWTVNITAGNALSRTNETQFAQFTTYFATDVVRFVVESPRASILPIGAEIPILLQVVDENGETYSAETIQSSSVKLLDETGALVTEIPTTIASDGTITGLLPAFSALGRYELAFDASVQVGSDIQEISQEKKIDVATLPWLQINTPSAGQHYPIGEIFQIDANVMLGNAPFLDQSGRGEVRAELYNVDTNELINQYPVNSLVDDINTFRANVPVQFEGNYQLNLYYTSQPLGGQEYEAPPVSVRYSIDPPLPTLTPTPLPTATPLPPTRTPVPTATPQPPPLLEQVEIPPAVFVICGLGLILPLLGLVTMLYFRSRPNLEGVYLEDTTHAGNDILFGSSYFGRNVKIYDRTGDDIATLQFAAGVDGVRVEVRQLNEGTLMFHGEYPIDEGEAFYPSHNDTIRIADVSLRFDNEADLVDDEHEFGGYYG